MNGLGRSNQKNKSIVPPDPYDMVFDVNDLKNGHHSKNGRECSKKKTALANE